MTCGPGVPYNTAAQTPCTVAVTGAGGLNLTPAPNYANNLNAGTASASYTFAGDDNHAGSSGAGGFTIPQAPSTVAVSCTPSVTYTGLPQAPCAAQATGVGISPVNVSGSLVYMGNTNAGPATATASWAGDPNHAGSAGAGGFTIARATPVFSGLSAPTINAGATPTALAGTLKSGSLVPSGSVSITLNGVTQAAAITATGAFSASFATGALTVGGSPYTITYSYAGDANFTAAGPDTSKSLTVKLSYTLVNVKNLPPAAGVTFKPSSKGTLVDFEWKFTKNGVVVDSADSLPSVTIQSPSGVVTTYTPANCASAGIKFVYNSTSKLWDFHWVPKNAAVGHVLRHRLQREDRAAVPGDRARLPRRLQAVAASSPRGVDPIGPPGRRTGLTAFRWRPRAGGLQAGAGLRWTSRGSRDTRGTIRRPSRCSAPSRTRPW